MSQYYGSSVKLINNIVFSKPTDYSTKALHSDHLLHMKHNSIDLSSLPINNKVEFASYLNENNSNLNNLTFHVRTNQYKNDFISPQASTRNSNSEILRNAIYNVFSDYNIYDWEANRTSSKTV